RICSRASSMSPAVPSSTSPMKRRVTCKLPASTHLAPGRPPASAESRSLSSGGSMMPTKRRIIAPARSVRAAGGDGAADQPLDIGREAVDDDGDPGGVRMQPVGLVERRLQGDALE